MTQVGIVGLGNLGRQIAWKLHNSGSAICSFTRNPRETPWKNVTNLSEFLNHASHFSEVVLAAGPSKPSSVDYESDLKLSLGIANRISDINSNVRFIYLSSGAVYGECDQAKKESDIAKPTTSYGIAKYAIENQLRFTFPNQLTVLRIGNVFGSDQSFGLMAKLRSVFESGETFNLIGSLETSRDYMSEKYFADAVYSILVEKKFIPVINVGSGISLTIAEIINIFERELNYKFRIWVEDVTEDHLLSTKLSISHLNSIFPKSENPEKLISKYAKETLLI